MAHNRRSYVHAIVFGYNGMHLAGERRTNPAKTGFDKPDEPVLLFVC